MLTCPGEDQLLRYAQRRGDGLDHDLAEVSTHLETCADCRRRVEDLSGNRNGQADALPTSDGRSRTPGTIDPPAAAGGDADWPATASRAVDSRATVSSDLSPSGSSGEGGDQERGHGPVVPGYEVMERLGEGGMGVVYKARQLGLNRLVALKMIREDRQMRPDAVARFRSEAEAVARLGHPNIIQIYEIGEAAAAPFVALELLEGGDLNGWLAGNPRPGREAAELMATLARAIDFAHRAGIVHRDLKPSNILLTVDGVPRISDFGLAKRIGEDSGRTYSGQVMGTPSYMAPEQAEDSKQAGPAADVYALGAIFYEMLVGRPPFKGVTPLETVRQVIHDDPVAPTRLVPRVARDLETICLKCLAKDPLKRYASALDLADDLKRYLDGEPIHARPASALERGIKWARRRPAGAGSLGALALLSLGLLLAAEHERRVDEERTEKLWKEGTQKIQAAREAIGRDDLAGARAILAGIQGKIQAESALRLRDLNARADFLGDQIRDRLEEQSSREAARAREEAVRARLAKERADYQKFLRLRNEALLRDAPFAGFGVADDREAKRRAAESAVGVYAADPSGDSLTLALPESLSRAEKDKVTEGCYELLLILAESEPSPRQGLRRLAQAASLHLPETQAYHLHRAAWQEKAGNRTEAERQRRAASSLQPVGAVDHFLLGQARYKSDPVAGLRHFDDALHDRPDHFWAQCLSAICMLQPQVARPTEAHDRLTACLNREPEFDPWLYLLRGFAASQQAGFLLDRAAKDPSRKDNLRDEAARPLEHAEADYGRALALLGPKPGDLRYALLVNRGLLRLQRAQHEKAAEDLREAIGLKGSESLAFAVLAQVYQQQGRLDEAYAQFTLAIERQSDLARLYLGRARVDIARKSSTPEQRARALRDLERAIALERPEDHRALAEDHLARAKLLEQDHRVPEALEACKAALAAQRDLGEAHLVRIRLLQGLKDFGEVVRSCDELIGRGAASDWVLEARGQARSELKDYAGAIEDYTRALALARGRAPILLRNRGRLYLLTGAPQLALRDFEMAVERDPRDGDGYEGRGAARAALGQYRDALADAEESLRPEHGVPSASRIYRVARIYAQAAVAAGGKARREGQDAVSRAVGYRDRAVTLLLEALRRSAPEQAASIWGKLRTDPVLGPIRRRVAVALERGRPALSTASAGVPPAK